MERRRGRGTFHNKIFSMPTRVCQSKTNADVCTFSCARVGDACPFRSVCAYVYCAGKGHAGRVKKTVERNLLNVWLIGNEKIKQSIHAIDGVQTWLNDRTPCDYAVRCVAEVFLYYVLFLFFPKKARFKKPEKYPVA